MALKIIAVFVGLYAFVGLVGGLQLAGASPHGFAELAFTGAYLLGGCAGLLTVVWLLRRSRRAASGLRAFGLAFLLVILLLPFQGHFYTSWHAVAAILLGGLLWAIIVEYLARYVARTTAVAAA